MQREPVEDVLQPPKPVLRVFDGGPSDDSMDLVAFREEKFSEVGTVLTGDTGDECASRQVEAF